jgi:hypothetical protein
MPVAIGISLWYRTGLLDCRWCSRLILTAKKADITMTILQGISKGRLHEALDVVAASHGMEGLLKMRSGPSINSNASRTKTSWSDLLFEEDDFLFCRLV